MPLLLLRGRKLVDRIRHKGSRFRGKHMNATFMMGAPRDQIIRKEGLFMGTTASTKLSKFAVKRNRMRRRCKEAIRTTIKDMDGKTPSCQLIIAPRSSSLTCDFAEIREDAEKLLRFLQHQPPRR